MRSLPHRKECNSSRTGRSTAGGDEKGRTECRMTWNSSDGSMPSSMAATLKASSRPCIPMSFGQMEWMTTSHGCSYWKRQWASIHPHVEPVEISPNGRGEVAIKVHQVVRDLKGNLLADRLVTHVFQMRNVLIQRFDIRDVDQSGKQK